MRVIITLLIALFALGVSAQRLDYNRIQTETLKMLINDYNAEDLSYAFMALNSLNSEKRDLKEFGNSLLKKFPYLKESVEASRPGRLDSINCHVNFNVDVQGKLTIGVETEDGKTILEFGKSKRQDLCLDAGEGADFDIAIVDHDNGTGIGVINFSPGVTVFFTGNITYIGDIEVIALYAKGELETKNIEVMQQLKQKLQTLFKPDEDGMLVLESE